MPYKIAKEATQGMLLLIISAPDTIGGKPQPASLTPQQKVKNFTVKRDSWHLVCFTTIRSGEKLV